MMETWVVVADSSAARIYESASVRGPLTVLEQLSHPESRAQPGDVYAGAPGRVHDRFGAGRHAVAARTELHAEERHRFAREIAERLETAHQGKRFTRLILMAPPAFLGALRAELSKAVALTVVGEVHKNLLDQDQSAIEAHLP